MYELVKQPTLLSYTK